MKTFELEDIVKGGRHQEQPKEKIPLIHDALVLGIKDYFGKLGFKQAILGLSGGIDSAVVAVLAARALGEDNVRGLLMPSQFSSDHSVNDARQLAVNLGMQYDIIPIEPIFNSYMQALEPHFWGNPFNIAEENIQARIRGMLVMAISNKFGNILLNTTNKSEMAVGYVTLYGDLCGGLSVISDVTKGQVYHLARLINRKEEIIPQRVLTREPSAELKLGQKDSDALPPYEVVDAVLKEFVEEQRSPEEICRRHGYEREVVEELVCRIRLSEYKRRQSPPGLRVSERAFSVGRHFPIVHQWKFSEQAFSA